MNAISTWWSQPFPPEGAVASEGIRKQLGAPALDPLVVLLRETSQNSCDARLSDGTTVEVTYAIDTLTAQHARDLAGFLLPSPASDLALEEGLTAGRHVLRISDRGTTGLGGPVRSDAVSDESADFVNFLRNVGEARDRHLGGGTYGFGKGILFSISKPSTILVDTRCRTPDGGFERRLMGAALGHSFAREGRRFTGRHWWGISADAIIDPFVGKAADAVASRLGLLGFRSDESGTDIYVIDPEFGEADGTGRSAREAAELLTGSAAWYLWPKLLERNGFKALRVNVNVDGESVATPDPARSTRLQPFVAALRKIDDGGGVSHTRARHPKEVGTFAFALDVVVPREERILDLSAPFGAPAHHCARMRQAELVVDYFDGPALADGVGHYGAVFRSSEEADEYFAAAEPPTHDGWVTQHLTGTPNGVVTKARQFVRDQLRSIAEPPRPATATVNTPLGHISAALASIIPGTAGDGAEPDGGGDGSGSRGSGPWTVKLVGQPRLVMLRGEAQIAQPVRFRDASEQLAAQASASVSVDGGREKAAPMGAARPQVVSWSDKDGRSVIGDTITVAPTDTRDWIVFVRPAPGTSTVVDVRPIGATG